MQKLLGALLFALVIAGSFAADDDNVVIGEFGKWVKYDPCEDHLAKEGEACGSKKKCCHPLDCVLNVCGKSNGWLFPFIPIHQAMGIFRIFGSAG